MPHALNMLRRMAACLLSLAASAGAPAHPIVSTDINRHVTLTVGTAGVEVQYLYEMLEIAAINIGRRADTDADGSVSDAEREAYGRAWGQELLAAMQMRFGGQPVPLTLQSVDWTLGSAPFGLHTWTLRASLMGTWPTGVWSGAFVYQDGHRPGEAGWKEVVLRAAPKVRIRDADAGTEDRSARLMNYQAMADLPNPEQLAVHATVSIAAQSVAADDESRGPQPAAHEAGSDAAPSVRQKNAVPEAAAADLPRAAPANAPATKEGLATTAAGGPSGVLPVQENGSAAPMPAAASMASTDTAPNAASDASAWGHYVEPFFRLGMHHIATGWDHLAFLLGLLLFRQTLKQLVWVVTAFTLAHSLTLGLAALGWVTPPGAAIEALIALSIAYVGAMSLWRPQLRHGPWIAMGFGLIHGFGFAGALGETLGEVDASGWLIALASFNLGIEFLQVLLVAAAFGLLAMGDRLAPSRWPRKLLGVVVLVSGLWWTLERTVLA